MKPGYRSASPPLLTTDELDELDEHFPPAW